MRVPGRDFPGGTMVKNLLASAGDTGSIPGLRRLHMPQGNEAHAPPSPHDPESVLCDRRGHRNEKPVRRN